MQQPEWSDLPTLAYDTVLAILVEGEGQHKPGSWKQQSVTEHISRARTHMYLFESGDDYEPHLMNAICRLTMALSLSNGGSDETRVHK